MPPGVTPAQAPSEETLWKALAIAFILGGTIFTVYSLEDYAIQCSALVFVSILMALVFDFSNGVHDAANAIATIVATRVLTPLQAVVWAAFFNVAAAGIFGIHVAMTVGKGIVDPEVVDTQLIFGALLAAILWNFITWSLGLPTSSSHALIGGFIGAVLVKAGWEAVNLAGVAKIVAFIVLSPTIGLVLGMGIGLLMTWLFRRASPSRVDHLFRKGQLLSAALYSLGHGSNDSQKTMGIIALLLYSSIWSGKEFTTIPNDIILMCYFAMGLGTLMGGWRIVKTMGSKITKLKPFQGFAAESGAAVTLFATALAGIPVSTTHTITGSIIGVGSLRGTSAIRWGVARNIMWAWVLTIPIAGAVGAMVYACVAAVARAIGT